jgi:hypothetical protein
LVAQLLSRRGYPAEEIMLATPGSRDVTNDSITVDSDQQFAFWVTPTAKVVVLRREGRPCAPTSVAAPAASLRAHRNHFRIRVARKYPSSVLELDEQYHP